MCDYDLPDFPKISESNEYNCKSLIIECESAEYSPVCHMALKIDLDNPEQLQIENLVPKMYDEIYMNRWVSSIVTLAMNYHQTHNDLPSCEWINEAMADANLYSAYCTLVANTKRKAAKEMERESKRHRKK